MSINIDWLASPVVVKSDNKNELIDFLDFLSNRGIKKHSIIMEDRESGGFLFFIYSK